MTKNELVKSFLRKNILVLSMGMFLHLLHSTISILLPLSIGTFYELLFGTNSAKGIIFQHLGLNLVSLESFFILFCVLIIARALIGLLATLSSENLSISFISHLRKLLYQAQLTHTLEENAKLSFSKQIGRYSSDFNSAGSYIGSGIIELWADVFFIFLACAVIFLLEPVQMPFIIAPLVIGSLFIWILIRIQMKAVIVRNNAKSNLLNQVSSTILNLFAIKSLNRETPELNRFERKEEKLKRAQKNLSQYKSLVSISIPLVFYTSMAVVLYHMASQISSGAQVIDQGNSIAFILILLYMQSPYRRLIRVAQKRQNGTISINRILTLVNIPTESQSIDKNYDVFNASLKFHNVGQHGWTFEIFPGKINFIVCNDDLKRMDLICYIMNMKTPNTGEITADGVAISKISPRSWRRNVSLVSEETKLLGSRFYQTIFYSEKSRNDERAFAIMREFDLPQKSELMDMNWNSESKNWSKSDKYCLQYIRSFLSKKKILLFENPQKNLSEKHLAIVVQKLNKLSNNYTRIIISSEYIPSFHIDNLIEL